MRNVLALALLSLSSLLPACADPAAEAPAESSALSGDRSFSEARGKLEEVRGDLASNQAHLRGALTPAQTQAYSAAFWRLDRVEAAHADYAKRANALAASLAEETAKLEADKPRKDCIDPARQAKIRDLYDAAQDLAKADVVGVGRTAPARAVDALHAYLATDAGARKCVGESLEGLEKRLGANHAQMLVQVKLEQPELDDLAAIKATFKTVGGASSAAKAIGDSLERFASDQDGEALRRDTGGNPIATATGAALAIMHVGTLANDLATGRYKKFLKDSVEGGADDVATIAEAVGTLEGVFESGRAQAFVERTAAFAKIAGKIAGGIGVVTTTISLVHDIEGYRGDRLLYVARIAADAAALQAGLVALAEVASLGPAAVLTVLLTQSVLAIAEYWHAHVAAGRRNRDTKDVLRSIGLAPRVADVLADADHDVLEALTGKRQGQLGLEPADVQALAVHATSLSRGPESFFTLADDARWIHDAAETKRVFALSSADTAAMLREASAGTDGIVVRVVFDGCVASTPGAYIDRASELAAIDRCQTRASVDDERRALGRLGAFLRAH